MPRIPPAVRRLLLLIAVSPAPTFAQAAPTADLGGSALQLILSLLLVLGLLWGSLWLLKRLSAPRGVAGGLMKVVAATAVGTRERVVVVEVGSTWLVLGVAPGRVSALAEIPQQALPPPAAEAKDFSGWLRQVVERKNGR
ncbi:MAG: flagellar biosynthetic protein FliO [Gammaproteobacteria bacterium]|nr:flagellar biosynthetic protein FliO [Gammaproteobacteria bacterium]MBU1646183.1 flagellar biosynthetic protein FliO [Gammaproteobacteria bacterium]MBU1972245.1 flagellar biosynthetic protein FliO [Gammaproteobacteria bacterium]